MERMKRVWERVQSPNDGSGGVRPKEESEGGHLLMLWSETAEEKRALESLMRRSAVCRQRLTTVRETLHRREGQLWCEYFLRFGDSPAVPPDRRHWQKGVLSSLRELYTHMNSLAKRTEDAAAQLKGERLGESFANFALDERRCAETVRKLLEQAV